MRLIIAALLCSTYALAQNVVFRGVPTVRVFSTTERDDRQKLEAEAARKAECVVVQQGKKYLWRSRGDAPLTRVDTQQFTFFIHPDGLGFIKVLTGSRKETNAPADYIESFTRGFEVVTYWGNVSAAAGTQR